MESDYENLGKELKRELLNAFNLPTKGLKRRENTIMTRISHEDLQIMNALVELGIFKSISETAAFMIHDSIISKLNYYNKILRIFKEIKAKKLEAVATLLESVKEERALEKELSEKHAKMKEEDLVHAIESEETTQEFRDDGEETTLDSNKRASESLFMD
ncbi:hypothetical protein GF325_08750 [Candidatus Bathyarchaeota archaeon]|nr:hypothetical protein [Candidatus Bathyarchaeota archaeon]